MLWFYVGALIPVCIGGALFARNHRVNWLEWVGGTAIAFLMAVVFHYLAIRGMTGDVETFSGQIVRATFNPEWVEEYLEAVYRTETYTDSNGNTQSRQVFSHFETRYRTHREYWDCDTNIETSPRISRQEFEEIKMRFNSYETRTPYKGGFYSGDPNIYVSENRTGYIFPVTDARRWENRIKAAPSVFSYAPVPAGKKVFKWPENPNWRQSERLLGTASLFIDTLAWDQMNARLGPKKHVNVILVSWAREGADITQWQESAWIGGKKNDLVLCVGGATKERPPQWVRVFGWTEKTIVKRNLESILLSKPLSDELLSDIEAEIAANYTIKDWTKFDYIAIEPPTWAVVLYFALMAVTQSAFWLMATKNSFDK